MGGPSKGVKGKDAARNAKTAPGGGAALEEAGVRSPTQAEGRGTAERLSLAEGLRAARRERDPERKADMLAGILAHRSQMSAARLRREPPDPAVMRRVEAAFRAAPGARDNLVKVREVRVRLGDLPRVKVDAAILQLVRKGKFSLDTHEGVAGRLTRRERRAALAGPADRPYVYLVRRD